MPLRAMTGLVFVYHSIGPGWPSRSELGNQVQNWHTAIQTIDRMIWIDLAFKKPWSTLDLCSYGSNPAGS
jgi:hypothetical protein